VNTNKKIQKSTGYFIFLLKMPQLTEIQSAQIVALPVLLDGSLFRACASECGINTVLISNLCKFRKEPCYKISVKILSNFLTNQKNSFFKLCRNFQRIEDERKRSMLINKWNKFRLQRRRQLILLEISFSAVRKNIYVFVN